ncbi:MAG: ABC transporter permease subunit [Clostridium sp.]|nr:ABC transporter permease subunit [Clostridium sp.]
MNEKVKKFFLTAGSIVFWIIFWQIGASFSNQKLLLKIPLPLATVRAFAENCTQPDFWAVIAESLLNIILGFLTAVIIGTVGGLLAGHSNLFKRLSSPILHMVRAVPVAAFIIVAWLWIPAGILPSFISFLMVLPIIWSHVDAGLSSIDKDIVEMANVYNMPKLHIITKIKLPFILPQLRTGCITGLGIAWKAGVAAEIITSPTRTLGALLSRAKTSIDYEQVFAITLTIIILSISMEYLLKIVWKEQKR